MTLFHFFHFILHVKSTATNLPVPNNLVVPSGYNFIPPPDVWSIQFEKIHQDVKCDDAITVQFNTQSGGPAGLAECKDQCMQIDNCRYFAYWPRRKVCKIYEKCTSTSPDGKNSIWLYKRLTQCDTEIIKPFDRSAIVQMAQAEFPGTVRYKQQSDNMFCTCITGSWMICAIVVNPGSHEDIQIRTRLNRRQNEEFLKPFQIVPSGSPHIDDYPIIYSFFSDEQVQMHAEMNVMDKKFCMDIQSCLEKDGGRCPISGETFKPGDPVYILRDDFQTPPREPVSCISITGLRSISMHQMSVEASGFPDPLGRKRGEILSEHDYYIIFLFTADQLRDGVCRDELAGRSQSEAVPSEPGPSGVSPSVKKKQARRKKRQEKAEAAEAAKSELELQPLSSSSMPPSPDMPPAAAPAPSIQDPGTSSQEELNLVLEKDADRSPTPTQMIADEDVDWKTIIWTEDVPERFLAPRPLTPNYDPVPDVGEFPNIDPEPRSVAGSRSPSNPSSPIHSPKAESPTPPSPSLASASMPQLPPEPPVPHQPSLQSRPLSKTPYVFTPASPQIRSRSAPPFTDFSPIQSAPITKPKGKDSPELNRAGVSGEISDSTPRTPRTDSPGYNNPNQPEVAGVVSESPPVYPNYLSLEQMAPVQAQSPEYPPERPPSPSKSTQGAHGQPQPRRHKLNPQVPPFTPNAGSPVVAPPGVLAVGMLGTYGANQIRQATQMGIDFGTTFSDRTTDISSATSADVSQMTASVTNQSQRSISSVSRATQTKPEPVTIGTQTLPEPEEKGTQTDPVEFSQVAPVVSPPDEPIVSPPAALSPVPSVASSSGSSGVRFTEEERRRRKAARNKRVPADFKEGPPEEQDPSNEPKEETKVFRSRLTTRFSKLFSITLLSVFFIYFTFSFFTSPKIRTNELYIEFSQDFLHQTL